MSKNRLLSKFDLFIFDWDGTLSSMKTLAALNERFNPHWRYKKKRTLETKRVDKKVVLKRRQMEVRLLAPLFDASVMLMRPKLHNDSLEVLQLLKKKHKKVALLTNGAKYRIRKELEKLKVNSYFDIIVSAQELNALKPNPLSLNLLLRKAKAKRSRVIYLGDMVDDVLMAKHARITSCALASGFDSYGKLKASKPDYLFRSMEEFKKAL